MAQALRVDRRSFLRATGLTAGLAVVTACGGATPAPAPAEPTTASAQPTAAAAEATTAPVATTAPAAETAAPSRYSEAPDLATKVEAGELPPVEERLPLEPLVVVPFEEPGEYGGDLRRAGLALSNHMEMYLWEGLTRWDYRTGSLQITPNIAKSWEINEDASVYTFYLREGMKWSDGHPFTADDVVFWYEDIALNEELNPSFPGWLVAGGEPVVIEKVDDFTVQFKFATPYAILLEFMCFSGASNPPFAPRHYLEQYHPNYADADELAQQVKARNFEEWYQLFTDRNTPSVNPELPSLWAWVPSVEWGAGKTVPALRNPYYWKVDTNGKQLPYIDRMVTESTQSPEICLMKAIAGEVDLQISQLSFSDYSLLKENEEAGDYFVTDWVSGGGSIGIYVNQSYGDDAKRELFQNRSFRHGLSHAINREEMNELFFMDMAVITHACGSPAEASWQEGFGQTAIEFDLDKANALLDEAGLDQRDSDGYRLGLDGKRLQLVVENYGNVESGANMIDLNLQVANYWQAVGVDAIAREVERTLWTQRALGNESEMPFYGCAGALWVIDPGWYVPYGSYCYWAPAYAEWQRTGGEGGMEPPQLIKDIIDWYDQLKSEPDEGARTELATRILQRHNEEIFHIGTCRVFLDPGVAKKGLVNYISEGLSDWRVHRDAINWPFQVWWRQS